MFDNVEDYFSMAFGNGDSKKSNISKNGYPESILHVLTASRSSENLIYKHPSTECLETDPILTNQIYVLEDLYVRDSQDDLEKAVKVYTAFLKEGRCIVAKYIVNHSQLVKEAEMMQKITNLNNENLIQVYPCQNSKIILMERGLCNLDDMIRERAAMNKKYTEEEAFFIIFFIISGLKEMHNNCIAHCDIKPKNIFLCYTNEEFRYKLGDFGISSNFSKSISSDKWKNLEGNTPFFYSLQKNMGSNINPFKYDIGCLGITMLLVVGISYTDLYKFFINKIMSREKLKQIYNVSEDYLDFCEKLMDHENSEIQSLEDLLSLLSNQKK